MAEDLMAIGFMLLGLGFFIFVCNMISRDHNRDREWRIMEAREFGSFDMSYTKSPKRTTNK
jgi:hypothetical protein